MPHSGQVTAVGELGKAGFQILLESPRTGFVARHGQPNQPGEIIMAEVKRTRRNTIERRCLGKAFKRLFIKSPRGVFKMLEKVKRA